MSASVNLSATAPAGTAIPSDLVVVGYITGAYGINGWVRIKPYSADADALLHAKTWWLGRQNSPELHDVEMMQAKNHSGDIVARLMGVAGRDAAEAMKGSVVHIPRSHFPALADDEFYWVDLIGLVVENLQGEHLGVVADLMDNGAHPILRITAPAAADQDKAAPELLIPFVEQFVKTVDQQAKKITVDWGLDY
ncbi:ribosome maturation factor RimM [Collimonas sp. H4R21]|uniref:Ribosome maturation factor RimM n=1 Tax=Collimonas rhizosphaerae TaxID=3126357 RepID=A0ABU9PRG8_9BURK|nr:ribosome maturation factor RimM [Collimonas sp. OK412]SFC36886.1 16S rRNA processing protein RimM [Collimonas sp. OK412]